MGRCILVLVFIRVREDREIEREDGEDDKRGVIDREWYEVDRWWGWEM